jgi:hypothetical protein
MPHLQVIVHQECTKEWTMIMHSESSIAPLIKMQETTFVTPGEFIIMLLQSGLVGTRLDKYPTP